MARSARSINKVSNAAKKSRSNLSMMADRLKLIAGTAVAFGGIALFAGWIVSVEKFNQAMRSSQAIMGPLTKSMKKSMTTAALEIARVTKFSATEVAGAYYYLASAGFNAEQSIAALPAVARFAQAGMFDLAQATSLLTDAQAALGMKTRNVNQNLLNMVAISDILVKANTLADASVEQFAMALANKAGAKMKLYRIEVEQGVAALAVLADQGKKAQDAGRAYAIVIRDLTRAAVKSEEAFAKWGIRVFDELGGLRDLADIIEDLEGVMASASTLGKKKILLQLGLPERSTEFLEAFIGTSGALREFTEALRLAGDTTKRVAGAQLTEWAKGWQAFTGALASFGRGLQPVVDVLGKFLKFTFGPEPEPKKIGKRLPAPIVDERAEMLQAARRNLANAVVHRNLIRMEGASRRMKRFVTEETVAAAGEAVRRAERLQIAYEARLDPRKNNAPWTTVNSWRWNQYPASPDKARDARWRKQLKEATEAADRARKAHRHEQAAWNRRVRRAGAVDVLDFPQRKFEPNLDAANSAIEMLKQSVYEAVFGGRKDQLTDKEIAEKEVAQGRAERAQKREEMAREAMLDRVAEAHKQLAKEWGAMENAAGRYFDATRTASERLTATFEETDWLNKVGLMSDDTMRRAMAGARWDFEEAMGMHEIPKLHVPRRGTRSLSELGGMAGAIAVSGAESAVNRELKELQKMRKLLEQINRKKAAGMTS